jgi:hypothetical protein
MIFALLALATFQTVDLVKRATASRGGLQGWAKGLLAVLAGLLLAVLEARTTFGRLVVTALAAAALAGLIHEVASIGSRVTDTLTQTIMLRGVRRGP